jgi:hypothetical protein
MVKLHIAQRVYRDLRSLCVCVFSIRATPIYLVVCYYDISNGYVISGNLACPIDIHFATTSPIT